MNVKFKMSKFGRNLTGNGWIKELLLTTLGTAIGLGLTIFVNDKVENAHQRSAQRETGRAAADARVRQHQESPTKIASGRCV